MRLCDVVMYPPAEVAREHRVGSSHRQSSLRTGERHVHGRSVWIADGQYERQLRRAVITLSGKANSHSDDSRERLPMRENFRQNRSPECLHVARFNVAFEESESSNHAAGLST